jgi:predicted acetyltransferase
VHTSDVYGTELAAEMAMWRFLLDLDLTSEVHTWPLPVDAPLLNVLADPRAAQPTVVDMTYVRLVDLDKALAARRYSAPLDVVLEVSDPLCPWNAGRWRLSAGADGVATCVRTSEPADVATGVRELGSAYLGGITPAALGRAGRVTELTPGALTAVSRAFAGDIAPGLPFGF